MLRGIMNCPTAPASAVVEIIKTFRGVQEFGAPVGWRVKFDSRTDEQNAMNLINMLHGWKAESHPDIKNMIKIYEASTEA